MKTKITRRQKQFIEGLFAIRGALEDCGDNEALTENAGDTATAWNVLLDGERFMRKQLGLENASLYRSTIINENGKSESDVADDNCGCGAELIENHCLACE